MRAARLADELCALIQFNTPAATRQEMRRNLFGVLRRAFHELPESTVTNVADNAYIDRRTDAQAAARKELEGYCAQQPPPATLKRQDYEPIAGLNQWQLVRIARAFTVLEAVDAELFLEDQRRSRSFLPMARPYPSPHSHAGDSPRSTGWPGVG